MSETQNIQTIEGSIVTNTNITEKITYPTGEYEGEIFVEGRIGTTKFEGFIFRIENAILVDEGNEVVTDLFRVEHHINDNSTMVMVTDADEYCVYEDASYFFDVDAILTECIRQYNEGTVADVSEEYKEYCESEFEWNDNVQLTTRLPLMDKSTTNDYTN